ncbi:Peroxyureidoacrylate/ureidoacrylate amidohydrolase RutB [Streptomyces sp. RB17]|uniref:cysteine hydrolase family protein n=1 Tax=Streptomyces sp. RB17 TaxID=2585197 RepID=UPI001295F987|nr:cysteine hydrolase family protein [Streptomyces sp. RB17]MQY38276.1 Peroxyureidoacrylate/ureidoacrylate amidohydrolase RutB [Streptomyces sp. RB17]
MTTLPERPYTALLVIDVQNGVMVPSSPRREHVIANIGTLVDKARAADVPVVWVQHQDEELVPGTESWEYVPQLKRLDSEPLVAKRYRDSFEDTDLESVLTERGVGRLLVTGAQSDFCIRSTLHGALARGYDATLIADAHTTEDLTEYGAPAPEQVIAHTNLYWSGQHAPGRRGGIINTDEVTF